VNDRSTLDDTALLGAVAEGDPTALRELYERHAPVLAARLRRRCADPDAVQDALQDTFLAAWKQAGRYRGDGEVAAWLWGISIRRLISRLRGRPAVATVPLREQSEVEVAAEDQVLAAVEYGDLAGALDRLSPEFRAVIQATVLDGLTAREASRLLGIPVGTVKTRAMRAKAQLRATLAGGSA
jgi:RNA polymerase sigma-70 factor, ECF subfamily